MYTFVLKFNKLGVSIPIDSLLLCYLSIIIIFFYHEVTRVYIGVLLIDRFQLVNSFMQKLISIIVMLKKLFF